jgi:hypothetical protein
VLKASGFFAAPDANTVTAIALGATIACEFAVDGEHVRRP